MWRNNIELLPLSTQADALFRHGIENTIGEADSEEMLKGSCRVSGKAFPRDLCEVVIAVDIDIDLDVNTWHRS